MRQNNSNSDFGFSDKEIRRVLNSSAGRQLMQMLSKSNANELQQAAEAIKRGDIEAAKAIMAPAMSNPQARELVKEINNGRD